MFAEIERVASSDAGRPCVLFESDEWTYGQALEASESLARALEPATDRPFVLRAEDPVAVISGLMASFRSRRPVALVAGCSSDEVAESIGREVGATALVAPADADPRARWEAHPIAISGAAEIGSGGVIVFTSGTSGPPKPVMHSWQSLLSAIHRSPRVAERIWLLAYGATRFAGLQVIAQALGTGGAVAVAADTTPSSVLRLLAGRQVDFATGTPSFWRMLIRGASTEELRGVALRQITLGGEVVEQFVLDELMKSFPQARITHVYASTEMGACFSVQDGLEGFPAAFVEGGLPTSRLRVGPDGELLIRSTRSMLGYLGEDWSDVDWFSTGDLVERSGDRFVFVGRKSDAINVGGRKVFPLEVEGVIRSVDGVADVSVAGLPSSVLGEVVRAEIVLRAGVDRETVTQKTRQHCQERLPKYKVPAVLDVVEEIPVSDGGKRLRRAEAEP